MSEMKIEAKVPYQKKRERRSKYPLAGMEVSDSFVVETPVIRSFLSKFSRYDEQKRKFSTRRSGDVYRVWRVK
jgi:hypothetical protein